MPSRSQVRVAVDASGEVTSAQDYYAYGEMLRGVNNADENDKYKFTGKEQDSESKYSYFGARYYDREVGLWHSTDPLLDLYPGISPYNYCMNNPINIIDYDGRDTIYFGELPPIYITPDGSGTNASLSGSGGLSSFEITGLAGAATGIIQNTIANDYSIFGKNLKFHKTGKGLNQYTGSKARALAIAKPFKIAGRIFFAARFSYAFINLTNNFNMTNLG